jgi:hypothetical protein
VSWYDWRPHDIKPRMARATIDLVNMVFCNYLGKIRINRERLSGFGGIVFHHAANYSAGELQNNTHEV